jgi:hypothetical protein
MQRHRHTPGLLFFVESPTTTTKAKTKLFHSRYSLSVTGMTAAWLSFALLGFLSGQVRAQIGTDQCACFPSTYTFVLDLALSCGQTSLPNSGVESNECSVLPAEPGAELSSMVPISLSEITVFELGQNLGTTLGTQIPGDSFVSGAPFTYTSSVGSQEGLDMTIASGGFPRGIEVQMRGRNLLSEIIDNRFTIVFSNECGIYPVIEEGDKIGWIKFVSGFVVMVFTYSKYLPKSNSC